MDTYLFIIQKDSHPYTVYITGYDMLNRTVYDKIITGESAELFGGDLNDIERYIEDDVLRHVLSKNERCIYVNAVGDHTIEDDGDAYVIVRTEYINNW